MIMLHRWEREFVFCYISICILFRHILFSLFFHRMDSFPTALCMNMVRIANGLTMSGLWKKYVGNSHKEPGVRWRTGYLATGQCGRNIGGTARKAFLFCLPQGQRYGGHSRKKSRAYSYNQQATCDYQWSEDLGGNQPDPLSGFIRLHWRAQLIKQAPVKSKQSQQSS
jgi:hypothetical protein